MLRNNPLLKKVSYKPIIIYGYILLVILFELYFMPGILNKSNTATLKIKKEYIAGDYINDEKLFNTTNMYFPIAIDGNLSDCVNYIDSFGFDRTYGGERKHEGCDIMSVNNIRGELPVVAVCDGVIDNIGWLELGGYRIGLKSEQGVYYYYAHLYRYEDNLKKGDHIYAGQIIGYIGDSGYSKVEGTTGNFDVHLHFGIYLYEDTGKEVPLNPYYLLKKLEKSVIKYRFQNS